VAARHTYFLDEITLRDRQARRQTQMEGQCIFNSPLDLDQRHRQLLVRTRWLLLHKWIFYRSHSGESHHMPAGVIGVAWTSGLWSQHLFKNQDVAWLQLERAGWRPRLGLRR